jgi:mannose-6-phosphate isomerase-like protein (cupin superfamily)
VSDIIEKPWGRERILELNECYAVKLLEIAAGEQLSLQYHNVKRETMYCLYGHATLTLYDPGGEKIREVALLPGRFVTIEPGQRHVLVCSKTTQTSIIETSTPELDDVVRIHDIYGRA